MEFLSFVEYYVVYVCVINETINSPKKTNKKKQNCSLW